eukprot:GHVR01082870.1.p1 GENE.GHVR01082870.1~~GHVR01082870.1.p1  ORF type:complete len:162 (-),score=29.55 GHVR01082870.1:1783-2268(-)
MENKQTERMKSSLHLLDSAASSASHLLFVDSDEEKYLSKFVENKAKALPRGQKLTKKEERRIKLAAAFDTAPELLSSRSIRPRIEDLKKRDFSAHLNESVDEDQLDTYKKLRESEAKANSLKSITEQLQLRSDLVAGGKHTMLEGGSDKHPIYKWATKRKK